MRNISKNRKIPSQSDAERSVHALVTSRLDYCKQILRLDLKPSFLVKLIVRAGLGD